MPKRKVSKVQLPMDLNPITALGPDDADDGDAGRQQRGLAIAALVPVSKTPVGYRIPSQSGNGSYIVNVGDEPFCSCPDFEKRGRACKHIVAVEFIIQREERPNGLVVETHTARVTYQQDWPAYNAAQEHEREYFLRLLRDLCDTIPQPEGKGNGRPRLPLSDLVFAAGVKVYNTTSTRRSMTDIRDAHATGLLDCSPSTASIWRTMEDPALEPILLGLIEASAAPLTAVEHDFAADGTGFSTTLYNEWHSHKWNRSIRESKWVKAHAMVGVKTNVITTAAATATDSHDSPFFAPFVERTAERFAIAEVSADKAYLSKANLRAVEAVGGVAYIPFKVNSTARQGHHKRDTLWERAFHYFHFHRADFLAHYHKRSNVETTFRMVKSKFGPAVRSKVPAAQVNEVLLKFLCHNIVVLVGAFYELGIAATFTPDS